MTTFTEANRIRMGLKMKFSNYAWYNWSAVISDHDNFIILINVSRLDNSVRKIISPVVDNVEIKTEVQ
jgi:hypothetical protein